MSRLADYLRRRAALSEEYARGLQKLNRQFSPASSSDIGLDNILAASDAVVGAHLLLAEQVQSSLLDGMRTTVREHTKQRRDVFEEIKGMRADWKRTMSQFDKTRKSRDAAVKAAEEARVLFEKANNDKNVTKAYVEKAREEYATKARRALVCKEEYIQAARIIRELQKQHYDADLPAAFNKLQKIEEARLSKVKLHLNEFGVLICSALGEELTGFREMMGKWEKLIPNQIVETFIDSIRQDGPFLYPEEIIIDESASVESLGLLKSTSANLSRIGSQLMLLDDVDSIQKRIDDLDKEGTPLEKQRDGVKVLFELYQNQPELADDRTRLETNRQFTDLSAQLESLKMERSQLNNKLNALLKVETASIQSSRTFAPSSPVLWEDSNPMADSPAPGAPNSCLSAIETNIGGIQKQTIREIFQATAVFDFDASDQEHELSIKSGEVVTILSNEGEWWHAQNACGQIGLVPFNYVRQL